MWSGEMLHFVMGDGIGSQEFSSTWKYSGFIPLEAHRESALGTTNHILNQVQEARPWPAAVLNSDLLDT